jgi:hypothetical protein
MSIEAAASAQRVIGASHGSAGDRVSKRQAMEQQVLQRQIEQYVAPPHVTSFVANLEPASSMYPMYRCASCRALTSSDGEPEFDLFSEWPSRGGDGDPNAPDEGDLNE